MKKLLLLCCMAALAGCYNDKEEELYPKPNTGGTGCDTANVSFAKTVKPILDAKCATSGCHDAATLGGGYNLSTYDGAKNASARLVGAITWASGYSQMPKGGSKLDDCSIAQITAWVNTGSPNN